MIFKIEHTDFLVIFIDLLNLIISLTNENNLESVATLQPSHIV